jgi:hypothetical protein
MVQLSLALGVLGKENTEKLQKVYLDLLSKGYEHQDIDEEIVGTIHNSFENELEEYCNKYMIYSELKVARDIVEELKQLSK